MGPAAGLRHLQRHNHELHVLRRKLLVRRQQAAHPLRLGGHLGLRLWLWLRLGSGKLLALTLGKNGTSWGRSRAFLPPPTSLIAANKRDYLPDKRLHARQLPKDTRRNNFGTGVIYRGKRPVQDDRHGSSIVQIAPMCGQSGVCVGITPVVYLRYSARGNCVCTNGTKIDFINDGVPCTCHQSPIEPGLHYLTNADHHVGWGCADEARRRRSWQRRTKDGVGDEEQ